MLRWDQAKRLIDAGDDAVERFKALAREMDVTEEAAVLTALQSAAAQGLLDLYGPDPLELSRGARQFSNMLPAMAMAKNDIRGGKGA